MDDRGDHDSLQGKIRSRIGATLRIKGLLLQREDFDELVHDIEVDVMAELLPDAWDSDVDGLVDRVIDRDCTRLYRALAKKRREAPIPLAEVLTSNNSTPSETLALRELLVTLQMTLDGTVARLPTEDAAAWRAFLEGGAWPGYRAYKVFKRTFLSILDEHGGHDDADPSLHSIREYLKERGSQGRAQDGLFQVLDELADRVAELYEDEDEDEDDAEPDGAHA